MSTSITTILETFLTQSFLEKILFSVNVLGTVNEKSGKSYGRLSINLKFTVSKAGIKILIHVVLISIIYCITEILSTRCEMLADLSHEVSWFLWHWSRSQSCQSDGKKQFITKLLSKTSKNIYITGFLKPKVTIFFISNKTRFSYFKRRNCRGKGFCEFQHFWPCLKNFNTPLIQKKASQ